MPLYALHTIAPEEPAEPPHHSGIQQLVFDNYPPHQTLGEFASDDEAFAAVRPLQAQHDAAAMKRVKRMGFVGIRTPEDLSSHRPIYTQCLCRENESGLTKVIQRGRG